MWQGRVPDSRRLLLIGTPRTRPRARRGLSPPPQPISRNASPSWRKQPGTKAQHWLQDVALGGQTGLGDTNGQGHAQAGDTQGKGVEPFGDTRGQGTSVTRVMCNEGTRPSWGHSWSGGASLGGTQLGITSLQGTHMARGTCPLGTPSWGMHPSKGHISPGRGNVFPGCP